MSTNSNSSITYYMMSGKSRIIIAAFLLFLCSSSFSATITSTATGGPWATPGTWVGGVAPIATDDVVIATTGGNIVTIGVAATCVGVLINLNAILTATTFGLTVNGPWENDGTYNHGTTSTVTFGGVTAAVNAGTGTANFRNISIASGAVMTVNTPMTTAGTFVFVAPATTTNSRVTITGTNTLAVTGAMTINRAGSNTFSATLDVGGGTLTVSGLFSLLGSTGTRFSTLEIGDGTVNLSTATAAGVASLITFSDDGILNISGAVSGTTSPVIAPSTGAVNYNGVAGQVVWASVYYNLNLSGNNTKTLNTGTTTINNLATIVDATTTLSVGTATLAVVANGTFLVNNGTFNTGSGAGTINYTATSGSQNVLQVNYNNIGFSGAGTKTITDGSTLTVAGNFATAVPIAFTNATNANIGGTVSGAGVITIGSGTITVGGNWTNSVTTVPGTSEVIISSASAQTIRGTFYKLTLSGGGAKTLTATTVVNNLLTIDSGNTLTLTTLGLTFAGSNAFVTGAGTLNPGSSTAIISFNGPDPETIPNLSYRNLTFGGAGLKTIAAGTTLNVALAWVIGAPTLMDDDANAIVGASTSGAGALTMETGKLSIGVAFASGTFAPGTGTIHYNRNDVTDQAIRATTYYNLELTGTSDKNLGTGTNAVTNVLTVDGCKLDYNTRTLALSGTGSPLQLINGGTFVGTTGVTSFTGAGAQTVPGLSYGGLTFSGGAKTIEADETITVAATWTIGSATVMNGNASAVIVGSTAGAGTLTMDSGTLTIGISFVSGTFTPGTGTVHYNGIVSAQTVKQTTYTNLEFSGAISKTLSAGTTTVTGVLTINTGATLSLSTTRILTLSGSGTPFVVDGTLSSGTSTVNYTGTSSTTIASATYYALNGTGGDRVLSPTGIIAISNVFTPGAGAYTITGSTINFNGTGAQTVPAFNYNNLSLSAGGGGGARTLASSGTIGIAGTFTPGDAAHTIATSTIHFNGTGSQTIPAFNYNNLNMTNGARILADAGTIGVAGVFTPGAGGFTLTGSTVHFNGGGAQTITEFNYNNLTGTGGNRTFPDGSTIGIAGIFIPGAGTYTITNSTVHFNGSSEQTIPVFNYNHLTGTGGDRILDPAGTVGIAGTFTPGAGAYTVTTNTVNFNGSGAQTIPTFTFNDVILSNGGAKTITTAVTVKTITIQNGPTLNLNSDGGGLLNVQ